MNGTSAGAALTFVIAISAAVRGIWSPCGLSMISAINPFSERARGNRYWLTAAWFVSGSVAGGAALGSIGAVGAMLLSPLALSLPLSAAVAAVCSLATVASDTSAFGFGLPLHPRQVNERWLGRYRRWVYAAGFGAQIGVGLATYIMTAAVYLVPILGALSGSWQFAISCGIAFGLVRGLAVLISGRAHTPEALRRLHRRLDRVGPWSLRVAVLIQAGAALGFGYLAAGWSGLALCVVLVAAGSTQILGKRRGTTTNSTDPEPTVLAHRDGDRVIPFAVVWRPHDMTEAGTRPARKPHR